MNTALRLESPSTVPPLSALPERAFVAKVKEAARRHRETLEGFGVLRIGMRDLGDAELQQAIAGEAASIAALCEMPDGSWALLVTHDEDGTRLNALAYRLADRTSELAARAGLLRVLTVSGGAVSGLAVRVDALALLDAAEAAYSVAFGRSSEPTLH